MTEPAASAAAPAPPVLSLCRVVPPLWQVYRGVRLAMLLDTPLAYGSTFAREVAFLDHVWLDRMQHSTGWLAFEGEQPVGAVTLFHEPGQPEDESLLVAMWVASHARGRGVADRLVATLLEHAREVGLRRVVLDVADANLRAIGFYERAGFTRTGRNGARLHTHQLSEFEMEYLLSDLPAAAG